MVTADDGSVRAIELNDHAQWAELYQAYREFYRLTPDEAVIERVWGWALDPANEVRGLVASLSGGLSASLTIGASHGRRPARWDCSWTTCSLASRFADRVWAGPS